MAEFFIGEIRLVAFNFAPKFWALCNGQLLPISQNQALFSLLGTQYGGNGTTTFALPDLRGRVAVGYAGSVDPSWQPPSVQIGQAAGVENVTLLSTNMPTHTHTVSAAASGSSLAPGGAYLAGSGEGSLLYNSAAPDVSLLSTSVSQAGGNQPHPNMPPYATLNYIIALSGIYPSRN